MMPFTEDEIEFEVSEMVGEGMSEVEAREAINREVEEFNR